MEAKGTEGMVKLLADAVVLEFGGLSAHAEKKKASPISIPLSELTGIEVNKGRRMRPNSVRFRTAGTSDAEPRPDRDLDTMRFITEKEGAALGQVVAAIAAQTGIPVSGELAGLAVLPSGPEGEFDAKGVRKDIAAAAGNMRYKMGAGGEIKRLHTHLYPGESVERIAQGTYEGDQGIVALTSDRVLFLYDSITRKKLEDFPYERISSVQTTSGMGSGSLVIYASNNKAEISRIMNDDLKPIADAIRQRMGSPRTVEPPAPVAPTADPIEQIKKLGELRDAGILSEEEFETKKAELLKRL